MEWCLALLQFLNRPGDSPKTLPTCLHPLPQLSGCLQSPKRVAWTAVWYAPLQHLGLCTLLAHMKAWQSHIQKKEFWSTDMFFQKQRLLYFSTEPAPWGWSEYEPAREWIRVAEHRKDKRPFSWHHTTRKRVIKRHSLIAATAKECCCEQEYSAKGLAHFSPSPVLMVLFPPVSSSIYSIFSLLAFPAPSVLSLSFSVCLPTIFLTVALLSLLGRVCLPFFIAVSFLHPFALPVSAL